MRRVSQASLVLQASSPARLHSCACTIGLAQHGARSSSSAVQHGAACTHARSPARRRQDRCRQQEQLNYHAWHMHAQSYDCIFCFEGNDE